VQTERRELEVPLVLGSAVVVLPVTKLNGADCVQLPVFPELELVRTTAVISHRSHGEFQMNKRLLLTAC
jgi:hypothetical protein